MGHPAQFSPSIINALRVLLGALPWTGTTLVFDPFAGEGRRLGRLCDDLGIRFRGIDLEDWPGHDHRVRVGNAVDLESYPYEPYVVVTSPTYANGVNDHFDRQDGTKGYTYRTALGHPLHGDNSGRYSIRGGTKALWTYWAINRSAVQCWERCDRVAVNVKDFIHDNEVYPLCDHWAALLEENGLHVAKRIKVKTPGLRNGTNRDARLDHEEIIVARRH